MAHSLTLSRRRAALAIAGSFAVSAAPAAAGAREAHISDRAVGAARQSLTDRQREITALLRGVHRAHGARARNVAFDVCAAALRRYDESQASLQAILLRGRVAPQSAALYRAGDPLLVLTNVIVRELTAWPAADAGWLDRFGDLETAFASHVAEHRQREASHGA